MTDETSAMMAAVFVEGIDLRIFQLTCW